MSGAPGSSARKCNERCSSIGLVRNFPIDVPPPYGYCRGICRMGEIMRSSFGSILFSLTIALCVSLPAMADSTAFTDLGLGGSYIDTGFGVCGIAAGCNPFFAFSLTQAMEFTASVGGTLSKIDVGLGYLSGTNSALVSVYSSDANGKPGVPLFSGTVMNQPPYSSASPILATLFATSGVLVAGQNYFVVVAPGASDTSDGWNLNNQGVSGPVFESSNGSGFSPYPTSNGITTLAAFDVNVNTATVPEPSTWLMLGAEIICLLGIFAAKRKLLD